MDKQSEKKFKVPKWIINAGKVAAVAGLAVVAGVAAIATRNEDKDDAVQPSEDYVPFARPKKQHYSDFELADFCRGGDLTED